MPKKILPRLKAPSDTTGLKQRLARDEREEAINRRLQSENEGKARDFRARLRRPSVGEHLAADDADHFKRVADGFHFAARARRDSLDAVRLAAKRVPKKRRSP